MEFHYSQYQRETSWKDYEFASIIGGIMLVAGQLERSSRVVYHFHLHFINRKDWVQMKFSKWKCQRAQMIWEAEPSTKLSEMQVDSYIRISRMNIMHNYLSNSFPNLNVQQHKFIWISHSENMLSHSLLQRQHWMGYSDHF